MLNKVPEVTLYFWIIKILATTVGETAADYLNFNLGLGLTNTSWVMAALLLGALALQLAQRRYVPWIYWLTVVLISVVGTLITDNLTDNMGVPLVVVHRRLRGAARRNLRGLVCERENALHPYDLLDQARTLLLGRDPVHLRAGHGRWRLRLRRARLGLSGGRVHLRRHDRRHHARLLICSG